MGLPLDIRGNLYGSLECKKRYGPPPDLVLGEGKQSDAFLIGPIGKCLTMGIQALAPAVLCRKVENVLTSFRIDYE
jgi:hypothetical protein